MDANENDRAAAKRHHLAREIAALLAALDAAKDHLVVLTKPSDADKYEIHDAEIRAATEGFHRGWKQALVYARVNHARDALRSLLWGLADNPSTLAETAAAEFAANGTEVTL